MLLQMADSQEYKIGSAEEWRFVELDGPRQGNSHDCGCFVLTAALFYARNLKFTFSQLNMPYMRRFIAYKFIGQFIKSRL